MIIVRSDINTHKKIEDLIPEYLTTYPLYLGAFARKDSFYL